MGKNNLDSTYYHSIDKSTMLPRMAHVTMREISTHDDQNKMKMFASAEIYFIFYICACIWASEMGM